MTIALLDFGSQYTELIARRCRELGVFCTILSSDPAQEEVLGLQPKGIILSGSNHSVLEPNAPLPPAFLFSNQWKIPILGVCYGQQIMAKIFGGKVTACNKREFGHSELTIVSNSTIFEGVEATTRCWMSHGDAVTELPEGFEITGTSASCKIAAMQNEQRRIYGVQFHPEVYETTIGPKLFSNFMFKICGCVPNWTPSTIVEDVIRKVRHELRDDDGDVVLGLSGGVDSSVVAVLLDMAIGSRLKCLMVDTGLLRKDEAQRVERAFGEHHPGLNFIKVDASDEFLTALAGVEDPEEKRKIIGGVFIDCFERHAKSLSNVRFLAQGTLYSDVIESSKNGKSALIKSHHNVGGLPQKMNLKLIEPVRHLFKDEVRKVGEEIGLPHSFVWRHPFPGPGLGVGIIGEVTRLKAEKLREADDIFDQELQASGWYEKSSQAFALLLPCKSVAVKGDARCYSEVIALRAVNSNDFMTARCCEIPFDVLRKTARRIANEVNGVSRVVFDLTDKPPATIEWE